MHHHQLTTVLLCSIMLVAFQSSVSARPAPAASAFGSDDRYPHLQNSNPISQSSQRRRARDVQPQWGGPQLSLRTPFASRRPARDRSYVDVDRYGDPYVGSSFGVSASSEKRSVRRSRAVSQRYAVERKKAKQRQTAAAAPESIPIPRREKGAATSPRTPIGMRPAAVISEARRYVGTNPTRMSRLWCARFMNMVLERTGHRGTGSDMALSFASYGTRVSGPRVGAIAVLARGRRGGHVGIVTGVDENGNPILLSGNHNRIVAEAAYPRSRIFAYVMPVSNSAPAVANEVSTAAKRAKAAAVPAVEALPDWSEVASAVNSRDSLTR